MLLEFGNKSKRFLRQLNGLSPSAEATVHGSKLFPSIRGTVSFFDVGGGVLVAAEINGLPYGPDPCGAQVHGFHIHSGSSCADNGEDLFAATGSHYNPDHCRHPQHAGDLPPLFSNHGFAWLVVFTDRFKTDDVIGKTVVIHQAPDDFTTQPAGNSGAKIACGVIQKSQKSDP